MLNKDTKSKICSTRYHYSLRKKTILKIAFYLFRSLFIQVRIGFNKCTVSNTVTTTVINAFLIIVWRILDKKKKR